MTELSDFSECDVRIEITPAMVDAGVKAYLGQASHDEMSFRTPRELVLETIESAIGALI
jgi:hypothetical protein